MAVNKLRYKFQEEGNDGCERSFYIKNTLDRGINDSGVLHWEIPADGAAFTDTSETYMCIQLRVVRGDGSELQAADQVFLTPGALQSLFSTCTVSLNGTALPVNTHYALSTTLLSYIAATQTARSDAWYALSGWAAPMVTSSQLPATTTPMIFGPDVERVAGSRLVTLYGRLASDFCMSCAQYLPPGIKLDVLLTRQPATFTLASAQGGDFRVELQSASLFVKRAILQASIRSNVLSALSSGGQLRYNRLSTILMPVAQGSQVFRWNNVYNSGPLPHSLYLVLLSQKAYYGSITSISNFFESGGLKSVRFGVNGRPVLAEPYACDFVYNAQGGLDLEKSSALGPFMGLVGLMGSMRNLARPVGISYNEFLSGCTMFTAQLDSSGGRRKGMESGSMDLELEFASSTNQPLLAFCFGEFDSVVSFDGTLNLL
jgi:hypothetical protein